MGNGIPTLQKCQGKVKQENGNYTKLLFVSERGGGSFQGSDVTDGNK